MSNGITRAERAKRMKQAKADILAAERVIAEIIWQQLDAGQQVDFPDIDVRAILGVDGPEPDQD